MALWDRERSRWWFYWCRLNWLLWRRERLGRRVSIGLAFLPSFTEFCSCLIGRELECHAEHQLPASHFTDFSVSLVAKRTRYSDPMGCIEFLFGYSFVCFFIVLSVKETRERERETGRNDPVLPQSWPSSWFDLASKRKEKETQLWPRGVSVPSFVIFFSLVFFVSPDLKWFSFFFFFGSFRLRVLGLG